LLWSRSVRKFLTLGCALVIFAGVCQAASGNSAKKSSHKATPRHAKTVRHSARHGRLVYAAEHKKTTSKSHRRRSSRRKRGQQKIDAQRAREIQEALIREHYLSGKPSGVWDSKTQSAMQRYQADNGWQAKTTPDSRALIKLGLGPDRAHLLNPETAMTGVAEASAQAADAKQPAKAVPAVDAKDKPTVKPVTASEGAPSASATANQNPAPAADPSPESKPTK
jgi:peptidoglycan hydrolase-like protein with peptidoglycan-binding domain